MVVDDLKYFHEKLYMPSNLVDLSGYIFKEDCKVIATPEMYKKIHNYAYEEFKEAGETCIDSIIKCVLQNFDETKDVIAPPKLVNYAFILYRNAADFLQFPTFYSQTVLPVIKYYTTKHDGFTECNITFNDIVRKVSNSDVNLLSDVRLNSGTNKLQEVFINNAGVCIFDCRVIPKDALRETIAGYSYKDGELNFKVDKRMLVGKKSILDWRSNDN